MAGVNACTFIGNAGRDPETRTIPSGKQVCSFSLGVTERKGEDTLWVQVECWDKLAGVVQQYVSKGKQVYVSGRLRVEKYTDKKTGEEKTSVKLTANTVQFLGGGERGKSGPEMVKDAFGDETVIKPGTEDEIPF